MKEQDVFIDEKLFTVHYHKTQKLKVNYHFPATFDKILEILIFLGQTNNERISFVF